MGHILLQASNRFNEGCRCESSTYKSFKALENPVAEQIKMSRMKQHDNESADDFLVRLRTVVEGCGISDNRAKEAEVRRQ